MIRLTVDGKDFSCENVDVLINYDYATEKTDIKLFNGNEELSFDDKTADFDIRIIVNSKAADLAKLIEDNKDFEASVRIIERANTLINRELKKLSQDRAVALELYKSLCKSILNSSGDRK